MGANTESQQPDIMERVGDLGTLLYNYESPSHPFSRGSGNTAEEAERLQEPEGMEDGRQGPLVVPKSTMIKLHMNSQRLRKACHGSVPDGVLDLKGELNTWPHP